MTDNKNKADFKKGLKIAGIISVVFFGFILLVSRPSSPCECLDEYKQMLHYNNDRGWRQCYKAYENKAFKEWEKKHPNYTQGQYYQAWGAWENTGMLKAYFKKHCNK